MSNSQNNNGSNSGFSLMTSLGGVIGSNNPSGSGGNASASTPAARLREGLTAMVSSPSNNSASSSFSKTSGSPSGIAVPLGRASNSFSSSSTYHQQLNQKQQQQRRRVPAYRTGHQSNSVPPQKHQLQQMFSGISPNYSMDSDDRRGGRDSSAESILKASSFDDCYKQNSTGFHDAFALLSPQNNDGAVVNKYMEISGNASSPAREKRRNFFPSSPLRSKNQHSPEHKTRPASAKSAHATVDGDSNNQHQRPISSMSTPVKNRHIGSVSSPPNTPPSTGNPATSAHSNNSIGPTSGLSQIASSIMSSPDKESSPSMFPPPPSGIKSKHLRDGYDAHATNAAISTSSTRHASPMAPSRMKHTLQKTWNKAKATTKGSIGVGHHVRQRSKGSGSYSEAVTEALKIENDDADKGIGAIVLDTGARKSAGDSAIESSSSQGGIEVISPVSMNSFNNSGGKIGKRLNRLRTRTRSPSPIRDLEGNLLSVDGSNVNTANDESKISSEFMTNNHGENESETTTPSFFRKSPNIRAMSPARMKKNLKKRLLAIPPSSRHDHSPQSHQPQDETSSSTRSLERSRQRDSPRLPLHPSTEVISNHSEEDDALEDVANLSLVNTSMSFDVDDYETSVLEEDKLHADSDAMTEVASNKTGSTSAPSITVNPSSSKNTDERTINEKPHPNNIFECDDFVRAMGGANEAALATNYIRTGDSLCTVDKRYDRAIPAYYAGLGAILSRTRRWGLNQCDDGFVGMDTSAPGTSAETPNIFHEYFQRIAFSMDMNILLLAMSSILLRAGNAHFHLNHWEVACQDYVSAEFYRSLRFSAFSPRETGRQKGRDEGDRKVALNNAINHDEWNGVSAVLEGLISNNMASAKSNRQMYEEARAEYTEALRIKQSALQALHGDNSQEGEPTPSSLSTHVKDDDLVSDIATTLHNIGLLRSKCGEPKKAEKAFTQSLSLRVKKFGLDDPGVSTTLRALGDLYFNEKRYDDSFRSYKESLRICKLHCGKPDLNAAELYYNIGLVFYSKGPYSKSKVSIMECLRIRRERCGNNNLNTASALYLLGLISSAMGEYDDAIIQFEEALAIRRNIIGIKSPNHLLMINVHVALGNVHQLNGDFDSAMDSYSLCLKERSERLGKHHPSVSEVLQLIGVAYITAAEYSKALETLEEALRIRQSLLGPSMEVAETLDSLGLLYFKSGDTEKAVELSEDSLSVLKSAVGFDHVLVSKVLKNIGDYYQDAEVYDDAIEAYSESIRVKTLWYGRDHTSLAEVLNEMGITRFKKGDYMIARQSFSQALRIMRADKNASNKSLIFPTLTHLGHALYKNRDFKLATETYLESFNIQVSIITGEENLGIQGFSEKLTSIAERAIAVKEDDSDFAFLSESLGGIASILRYLGLVYQEQGDIETALTVNKLSLSVRLSQPYKEYSAIALMAETIAMFEFKRANLNSALEYFNQALHAKKSYQGDSTIDVARTVNNLANIHFSLGNLDDAMKLYQDALEIKRLCLGNDSDEVANTLNNIAHVMVTAGKEQEALQAYHNVVRIRQDRYGKNHSSVATTLASMGDVYIKLGKLEIAMTYFEQCIRIQKLNQDHCDERVLENLASIYGKLGEWHKAESAFKEIVQLKRSVQGEDSLEVAKSLDLLAVSYIEQDRCVDSIEHLKEALRIRKACLSGEDGEILASLNKLAFVYKSCEMTTEMMDVKAEFDRIQNLRKK